MDANKHVDSRDFRSGRILVEEYIWSTELVQSHGFHHGLAWIVVSMTEDTIDIFD